MIRKVVVVLLTRLRPHRILILQRAPSKRSLWQPVTGRVDPGERIERAARREVDEETGVRYGTWLDLRWSHRFRTPESVFHEHGFALVLPLPIVPNLSGEHVAWRWVSVQEAVRLVRWPHNRAVIRLAVQAAGGPGAIPSSTVSQTPGASTTTHGRRPSRSGRSSVVKSIP